MRIMLLQALKETQNHELDKLYQILNLARREKLGYRKVLRK